MHTCMMGTGRKGRQMAERRMFSRKVIESGRMLKLSPRAQLLYIHLCMAADDDGVVEAFPVLSLIRAPEKDLEVLQAKGFISILNDDCVCYIADWKENNQLRSDRIQPSIYRDLLAEKMPDVPLQEVRQRADLKGKRTSSKPLLNVLSTSNGQQMDVQRTDDGRRMDTIGQDSNSMSSKEERVCLLRRQDKKEETELTNNVSINCPKPTLGEVVEFVRANGLDVDADEFLRACERDGWRYGGRPIRDWKALIRSWSRTGVASRQKMAGKVLGGGGDGEDLPYGSYRL